MFLNFIIVPGPRTSLIFSRSLTMAERNRLDSNPGTGKREAGPTSLQELFSKFVDNDYVGLFEPLPCFDRRNF